MKNTFMEEMNKFSKCGIKDYGNGQVYDMWTLDDGSEVTGKFYRDRFQLDRIYIPEALRKQGKAKEILRKIATAADKANLTITAFALPDEGSDSAFHKKWIKVLCGVGFEVDVEFVNDMTGMTKNEILKNDKAYPRDELIRFPR